VSSDKKYLQFIFKVVIVLIVVSTQELRVLNDTDD